jgi:hypothetical protein
MSLDLRRSRILRNCWKGRPRPTCGLIGIGGCLAASPLPHHLTHGSVMVSGP